MKIEVFEAFLGLAARAPASDTFAHDEAVTNRLIAHFLTHREEFPGLDVEIEPVGANNGQTYPYVYVHGDEATHGLRDDECLRKLVAYAEEDAPSPRPCDVKIAFDHPGIVTITGDDRMLGEIRLLADFSYLVAERGLSDVYAERSGGGLWIEGDGEALMREAIAITLAKLSVAT